MGSKNIQKTFSERLTKKKEYMYIQRYDRVKNFSK